ncbi:MAG TPA: hypothetical protein VFS14_02835 [Candidatus Saccharimonadales bacterium]|nr:hypothetical protein [Candidatus Saccharimonadales bacterium]
MENSQKPQTKTIAGLISFIALLALAVLGLVTAYYFQSDHVASLEYQVAHLKTSAEDAQKEPVKNEETPAAIYREIPELGVKYKLTDETSGLTYTFIDSGTVQTIMFSTEELTAFHINDSYPCTSQKMAGGIIKRFKVGDALEQVPSAITSTDKKIGNYYYLVQSPQAPCSENALIRGQQQAAIKGVQKAFDSLEAM